MCDEDTQMILHLIRLVAMSSPKCVEAFWESIWGQTWLGLGLHTIGCLKIIVLIKKIVEEYNPLLKSYNLCISYGTFGNIRMQWLLFSIGPMSHQRQLLDWLLSK